MKFPFTRITYQATLEFIRRCGLQFLVLTFIVGTAFSPGLANAALVDQLKKHTTSLHCEDLKVSLLLRAIGRQGGVNIFVDDNVKETITLDMEGLSLFEAFNIIMDTKHLTFSEKNNIILVEKQSTAESGLKNFKTRRLCTEYGNADSYVEQLKTLLSEKGKLTVSHQGNCLIVQDLPSRISRIAQMLTELDQPIPQVHIEAKIVSISKEAKKRLGINWDYDNRDTTRNPLTAISDLSVISPSTTVNIGFLRNNLDLGIELQAMQEDNMLKILSAPRILVLDGKEAEIKSGKEVPYQTTIGTGTGATASTSFREANLSLKVSPKIIKNEYVVLDVVVTNDSVDESTTTSGGTTVSQPLINKQEISTNLFLENNVTVVIGGILQETKDNQNNGVPILSHIPLLGWFFKSSEKKNDRSELLVFITPTIVNMGSDLAKAKTGGPIIMDYDKNPKEKTKVGEK